MVQGAVLIFFPGLMIFAAASDLLTMTISNRVSLILVAAFACLAVAVGLPLVAVGWHVGVACCVLVATFLMFSAGWIGGGDAKLAAATALWIGPGALFDYFLLASLLGGVLTLAIVWLRTGLLPAFALAWPWVSRLHQAKAGIPYGIALAAAGLLVYPATPLWRPAFAG